LENADMTSIATAFPPASRPLRWSLFATVLLAGCAGPVGLPVVPAKPAPGGFSVSPAAFTQQPGGPGALCTGLGGEIGACAPRPRPKFDTGALVGKPIVDLGAVPLAERPDWVLCRLDHRDVPPLWTCAEIYTRLPR
jgi:hypothetical protein